MTQTIETSYISTTDGDPFSFYEALRANGEVNWDKEMQAWLVSSYEGCKEVARADDTKFFMPERLEERHTGSVAELFGGMRPIEQLQGEEHLRMHNWWIRAFAPNKMAEWRTRMIRPMVNEAIDQFITRGKADLLSEFAQRIPVRAISAVMGLPWQDDDWIAECKKLNEDAIAFRVRRIGRGNDGDTTTHDRLLKESIASSHRLNEILRPIVLERKNGEGEDFISMMWRDGPKILENWCEEDVLANVRFMFLAGSDTTQHAMSNCGYLLATHPEIREAIKSGGEPKALSFVEEVLRLFGTVHFRSRLALEDTVVSGCPVAKGSLVIPIMAAANRDPTHYERPNDIDLTRKTPRDHLSFYFGVRTCVGAALARAELLEASLAIVERLEGLKLDPEAVPPAIRGWVQRSFSPVKVIFTPAVISTQQATTQ